MKVRTKIIQEIINRKNAKNYLEIGINWGINFLNIFCFNKIGVDPCIRISNFKKLLSLFKNPLNIINNFFEITSDEFFKQNHKFLAKSGLDVVFIDGLHTYEQSLKDILNSLKYLNKDGIIILHDCNPLTEQMTSTEVTFQSFRKLNKGAFTIPKCGDVWKSIVHLRASRNDLRVFVLDCNLGLGIITKGIRNNLLKINQNDIKNMSYEDLEKNRIELLNLKNLKYFNDFLKTLKSNPNTSFTKKLAFLLIQKLFYSRFILKINRLLSFF